MRLLDSWTRGEHSGDDRTFPSQRTGTGPGVIVIREIPGLTAEVIGFIRVGFPGRKHSTVTAHRQQEGVDRVLAFFAENLRA